MLTIEIFLAIDFKIGRNLAIESMKLMKDQCGTADGRTHERTDGRTAGHNCEKTREWTEGKDAQST